VQEIEGRSSSLLLSTEWTDWPEDGPLRVGFGLERQHDNDDEDGWNGETQQVPDERRQPVACRVHPAHELRVLRLVRALVDDEHHKRPDQKRQSYRHKRDSYLRPL